MTESGYSLERRGSVEDLAKHGLTLESAVGRRFTFYMDDADDQGRPDDIMWEGVVVHDDQWGYLAQSEGAAFYHRSDLAKGDANSALLTDAFSSLRRTCGAAKRER